MTTITKQQFDAVLEKVEQLKRSGDIDLSSEEDLSIAIMNLLSLEEHFFFTAEKTKKPEYRKNQEARVSYSLT